MKRTVRAILAKMLSLTLCLAAVLSLLSCTAQPNRPDEGNGEEQRLVVEAAPAVYSEQTVQEASARIVALCARLLRLGGGPVLNGTQKQKIEEKVKGAILPRLEQENVYEEELWELLRTAEEITDAAERGELESTSDLFLLLRFYQSGLATVDTQKMGRTVYCFLESWLEYKKEYSLERYEKYGYQWYLDDATRYEAHLTALHEGLGRASFCDMASMLMFGVSLLGGLTPSPEPGGAFALSDAETVMLIRRQASFFADKQITEAQWTSLSAILSEFISPDEKTLTGAQIGVLNKEGYLESLASLMPALLELYRAMADGLTEDEMAAWRAQEMSREAVVGRLLMHGSEAFLEFDRAWAAIGVSESDAAITSIRKMGLEEAYRAFLAQTPPICAEELIAIATECANTNDADKAMALHDAMLGYLRTYLPCMAFAMSQTNE